MNDKVEHICNDGGCTYELLWAWEQQQHRFQEAAPIGLDLAEAVLHFDKLSIWERSQEPEYYHDMIRKAKEFLRVARGEDEERSEDNG